MAIIQRLHTWIISNDSQDVFMVDRYGNLLVCGNKPYNRDQYYDISWTVHEDDAYVCKAYRKKWRFLTYETWLKVFDVFGTSNDIVIALNILEKKSEVERNALISSGESGLRKLVPSFKTMKLTGEFFNGKNVGRILTYELNSKYPSSSAELNAAISSDKNLTLFPTNNVKIIKFYVRELRHSAHVCYVGSRGITCKKIEEWYDGLLSEKTVLNIQKSQNPRRREFLPIQMGIMCKIEPIWLFRALYSEDFLNMKGENSWNRYIEFSGGKVSLYFMALFKYIEMTNFFRIS
jgi:hypothetical protein